MPSYVFTRNCCHQTMDQGQVLADVMAYLGSNYASNAVLYGMIPHLLVVNTHMPLLDTDIDYFKNFWGCGCVPMVAVVEETALVYGSLSYPAH